MAKDKKKSPITKNNTLSRKKTSPVKEEHSTLKDNGLRRGTSLKTKYTVTSKNNSNSGSGSKKNKINTNTGTGTHTRIRSGSGSTTTGSGQVPDSGEGGLQNRAGLGEPVEGLLAKSSLGSKEIDSSCNPDETGKDNEVLANTLDGAIETHNLDTDDAEEIAKTARQELDREIIQMRTEGLSYTEIQNEYAKIHGRRINRRVIARALKRFLRDTKNQLGMKNVTHAEIAGKMFAYSPEAVENIIKLSRKAKKEDTRLKANQDLLDRAGFVPVQKTINLHAVEQMTREELRSGFAQLITRVKERTEPKLDNVEIKE